MSAGALASHRDAMSVENSPPIPPRPIGTQCCANSRWLCHKMCSYPVLSFRASRADLFHAARPNPSSVEKQLINIRDIRGSLARKKPLRSHPSGTAQAVRSFRTTQKHSRKFASFAVHSLARNRSAPILAARRKPSGLSEQLKNIRVNSRHSRFTRSQETAPLPS
jgi:hypothetical protein